jgi:glucokinase
LTILIGLDVGGTSLKAAKLVDATVAGRLTLPAGGDITRDELVRRILHCIADLSRDGPPQAVGLCFGGLLQHDGTMREGSTNLSNLAGVPLEDFFGHLLELPCKVENDAIAAMRGEAAFGAARGLKNAMTMTFGSGIGSGLLLNGHIHRGTHHRAGEIGVWRLALPQASYASLEDIAAPARFFRQHGVELAELLQSRAEDHEALEKSQAALEAVGLAIANAHLLLDLEAVILTGGIAKLGDLFLNPVRAAFHVACPREYRHELDIRSGDLGPYAGAVGAAALWLEDAA